MHKKLLALGAALGLVVLLGAGCANPSLEPSTENNPNTDQTAVDQYTPPATTTEATTETSTDTTATDFAVTVTPTAPHSVSVEWTASTNLDKGSSFRVLNSAKPNPESPKAYWDQFMNSARTAVLKDVPTGHRYFRVCEYKNNACVSYSNEVEVDVQ